MKTTLDPNLQRAAEAALATSKLPASLVAVQASTGQILAAANGPTPTNYNRAFQGRYAPGSTFKVVTSAALLGSGLTASDLSCRAPTRSTCSARPSRTTTGWRRTANGTMEHALNQSCNTAFISQHARLPKADGMTKAAAMFGIGQDLKMAISAYGGEVPAPKDDVAEAASMIGQGTVTASPLAIATGRRRRSSTVRRSSRYSSPVRTRPAPRPPRCPRQPPPHSRR